MPPKKTPPPPPFANSGRVSRSPVRDVNHPEQLEEYNCRSCHEPDSAGNMVQCDQCETWSHYTCAGVDSFIQDEEWLCTNCCAGKNISYPWFPGATSASAANFASQSVTVAEKVAKCTAALTIASPTTAYSTTAPSTTADLPPSVLTLTTASGLALSTFATTSPSTATALSRANTATTATSHANTVTLNMATTREVHAPKVPTVCTTAAVDGFPTDNLKTAPCKAAAGGFSSEAPLTFTSQLRKGTKSSACSRASRTSRAKHIQIELQLLEEERALKEKREKEERERRQKEDSAYLAKKYQLLSQLADESSESEDGDSCQSKAKVNDWLINMQVHNNPRSIPDIGNANPLAPTVLHPNTNNNKYEIKGNRVGTSNRLQQSQEQQPLQLTTKPVIASVPNAAPQPPVDSMRATQRLLPEDQQQQNEIVRPITSSPLLQPAPTSQNPISHHQTPSSLLHTLPVNQNEPQCLTRNNIAARHLTSRDLQTFAGSPEEWPLFVSNFYRSTELCGFTDEENLLRLQRVLKGKALDAVRSLLIQPNCVQRVIATLKMLYGRPELIINTLLQKIHSTPPPKADKLETVVSYALAVQNLCATIEASGLQAHLNNPTVLQELVDKLPPTIRLNWAIYKQPLAECTLSHFSSWLYQIAEAANGVLVPSPIMSHSTAESKSHSRQREKGFLNTHYTETDNNNKLSPPWTNCRICNGDCNSVADCKQFQQYSRSARWSAVREHQLCRRCLAKHSNNRCFSTAACGINNCTFKHHRLLHNNEKATEQSPITTDGSISVHTHQQQHCESHRREPNSVLFRVVPVVLHSNGIQLRTYAFLDDGSSLTLVDEEIAKKLNVRGKPQPLCLKWTGNTHRYETKSELITLEISSAEPNARKYMLSDVHTVESLNLPRQSINCKDLQNKYEHLKTLAIEGYESAVPRLLIGLNNTKLGLPLRCKEGGPGEPVATKTRLGWIVHGSCPQCYSSDMNEHHSFHMCECNDDELQRVVREFIVMDNFGTSNSGKIILSAEDQRALDLLSTYTVRKDGHFETALLWKFDEFQLPDSLSMAQKRLACLQRRMTRDRNLAEALGRKIEEYVSKGYARKLSDQEIADKHSRSWYLPIFPVHNPNKPGKLRIVWDAAAKVQGVSLNSFLLTGPDQLASLTSVICKFREKPIAICGDIMEMFHQVRIREEDQQYQRFLWSQSADKPPDVYVMTRMTFGATCSPCCAQFIKNKNADEFANEFPRAVRSIRQNHYVDDLMDSVSTEEEAVELAKEIRYIHKKGGFHIRNWMSNSSSVLKSLKCESTEQFELNVDVELGTEKVLGMWWCTASDKFTYKLNANPSQAEILSGSRRPTKREVLRILMKIFDPLGLLAHYLMYIKILLQDIWRSKVDWDTDIKDEEFGKWLKWIRYLPAIEKLKIPRCYVTTNSTSERQLHVFVDASENGFAAVAYVRTSSDDLVECALIGAKTRVAPLKTLSIPRLELQAAVLGARFARCITESHAVSFSQQFLWSDSKNVLSWLRSDHRRYKQFVAFRVSEILDLTQVSDWRWIPTKINVADEGTKWQKLPDFSTRSRWFTGPEFLQAPQDSWPHETTSAGSTTEELKTHCINVHIEPRGDIFRVNDISCWNRLLRSTAFAFRFINNIKAKKSHPGSELVTGLLSKNELVEAENALLREAQASAYQDEIAELLAKRTIEKCSPIFNLCPYLDDNGLLRINGRIARSKGVSDYFRNPIVLPRHHRITRLIIMDYHCRYKHQNHETVINELRQRFHIPRMRVTLNTVRQSCQHCKNNTTQPQPPIMSQLPPARLAAFSRPFSFVGVDYFGPMTVTVLRRSEKRWGVLLTCLTTRAVHIEIAHTMTSDSCILSLRNFMARRGTPTEIYSDNGTNFQGAERELREAMQNINKEKLIEAFTSTTTEWKFIPPSSPHMGGSWERLVRSIKTVLYKIMPTRNPSDELLRSMLLEVENIVNSRPLTYIPIDNESEEALTPNHFLLGSSNGSKPLAVFNDDIKVLKRNWQTSQQYADRFWGRWVREYLPTLTRRTKWFLPVKPIDVGDIVLIVDPNSPRNCWQKGRVVQTNASKDGQVRSAVVQTQSGLYTRPTVKLAILDVVTKPSSSSPQGELPGGSVSSYTC